MRPSTLHPLALVRGGIAPEIRRQVRRDLRRGLTTGSRAYQRAMAEAKADYDRAMRGAVFAAARVVGGGSYTTRADGRPHGVYSRFGSPARKAS